MQDKKVKDDFGSRQTSTPQMPSGVVVTKTAYCYRPGPASPRAFLARNSQEQENDHK